VSEGQINLRQINQIDIEGDRAFLERLLDVGE
jgi:hypothetical protein